LRFVHILSSQTTKRHHLGVSVENVISSATPNEDLHIILYSAELVSYFPGSAGSAAAEKLTHYAITNSRYAAVQDHKVLVWLANWTFPLIWATLGITLAGYGDTGACKPPYLLPFSPFF